ncbi:Citrate lyase beta subunit [Thiorhodovibrio winogradskyi]|uniref:Citrate lyase beta subunit n=1 Tax=Thiorhodovibrio winogradskyi TaxID=77007 RepID=A0ABZ0SJJ8_9GAMM|nr:HpcH/HpaI aldolase/citrate lyase family protein [Thiorhodovibrio winogradskyi]
MLEAYRLGGSLYVPLTHKDCLPIANASRWPSLRSVIFCTEDAVAEQALGVALDNLRHCLERMEKRTTLMRFVRVRNPEILDWLLALPGAGKLDGFVLPKLDLSNFDAYFGPLAGTGFRCMPTLETLDVFDVARMRDLRDQMLAAGQQERILALRIGGNDLLALLGLRRPRDRTIYRTPLGPTIANLVTTFKPFGFQLTAPVFEHLDCPELLSEELAEDIAHGLCGKTAIHPKQLASINAAFQVTSTEVTTARQILLDDRAVFQYQGSMCEPATHRHWARQIVARANMDMG